MNLRFFMRIAVALALSGLAAAPGALAAERARLSGPGDPVYNYADDATMEAAIAEARGFLPQFFSAFALMGGQDLGPAFALKVALPVVGVEDGFEHIWVGDLERLGADRFAGALINHPNRLDPSLKQGSRVEFKEDMISDWWILSQDGLYGAFTVRVILKDLPPAEAAAQKEMLSAKPVPESWR